MVIIAHGSFLGKRYFMKKMIIKICPVCRRAFAQVKANQQVCSKQCWYIRKRDHLPIVHTDNCRYNEGVQCTEHNCEGCGWYPPVAMARARKIRKELHLCVYMK